jgi:hypothetical protein
MVGLLKSPETVKRHWVPANSNTNWPWLFSMSNSPKALGIYQQYNDLLVSTQSLSLSIGGYRYG